MPITSCIGGISFLFHENDMMPFESQDLVQKECERWLRKGLNIHYIPRDNRNGYKAGALKAAMEHDYVKKCDYVAIFDADHQPPCDFLMRTIPFLIHNPRIALVQARWMFGKPMLCSTECILAGSCYKIKKKVLLIFPSHLRICL